MAKAKIAQRVTRLQKTKTEGQQLTVPEVKRLAEKLAAAFCSDTENVQLLTLLLQHLWGVREDSSAFWCVLHTIEAELFIVTSEADEARRQFRTETYRQRGKILSWPGERKETA